MIILSIWKSFKDQMLFNYYELKFFMQKKTAKLIFPLEGFAENVSNKFGEDCSFGGVHWGIHLGADCPALAGTKVLSIGDGVVEYSALHAGTPEKSNWGNIIIISHVNSVTGKSFFSLYGHLGTRLVAAGDKVEVGQSIGVIGAGNTPENGMWPIAHLHLAIYTGVWEGKVLPGYFRSDQKLTKLRWWKNPVKFIEEYNA